MALRRLRVDMPSILDAMEDHGSEVSWWLDLDTGEVEPLPDDGALDGEDEDEEREADLVEVPQTESRDDYRAMEEFAAGLADAKPDVHEQLQLALAGKGAFGRFRQVLSRFPDLQARWEQERQRRLLQAALEWLAELDIEPEYELRPPPQPQPQPAAREPRVRLLDLLLLGAPGPKARGREGGRQEHGSEPVRSIPSQAPSKFELIEGQVHRLWIERDPGRARGVFRDLAQQIAEFEGIPWRKRLIEGTDRFDLGRFHLRLEGGGVVLAVDIPRATWEAFARQH